jgi:hypothetical protein
MKIVAELPSEANELTSGFQYGSRMRYSRPEIETETEEIEAKVKSCGGDGNIQGLFGSH